jgi:hypothetical protein
MLKFKIEKEVGGERQVVEVWDGDLLVASIYPHEKSIGVVSKFLRNVVVDDDYPPKATIEFDVNLKRG